MESGTPLIDALKELKAKYPNELCHAIPDTEEEAFGIIWNMAQDYHEYKTMDPARSIPEPHPRALNLELQRLEKEHYSKFN